MAAGWFGGGVLCRPHSFRLCRVQHGKAIPAVQTSWGENLMGDVEAHGGQRGKRCPERKGHAAKHVGIDPARVTRVLPMCDLS